MATSREVDDDDPRRGSALGSVALVIGRGAAPQIQSIGDAAASPRVPAAAHDEEGRGRRWRRRTLVTRPSYR
ncbi:hypothetical protein BRADI_2g25729v3 [Brachypodium distachyon]|uniref:Uncharacterized protein n=1 Tax=Brachypodium distachyon TaxID=15368 RepID=A0A2K2DAJ0_BRADI|nr:hypothetical protein BRADI_2g25729v3 [Brachypodium distachyon]